MKNANLGTFTGRRVLITGAYGFVGQMLTSRLQDAGANVFAVMNQADPSQWVMTEKDNWIHTVRTIQADLRERDSVESMLAVAQPDFVFHLAAITQVTEAAIIPGLTWETNVMGTVNLCDALLKLFPHAVLVAASSDKFYGNTPEAAKEADVSFAVHPYDSSKLAMENAIHSFFNYYDPAPLYSIVRCVNIFGQGDFNYKRIIPEAIRQAFRGHKLQLRSDGDFYREYVMVHKVVNAYLAIAEMLDQDELESGEVFNLGGHEIKVYDLAVKIYGLMGLTPNIGILDTAKGESRYNRVDDSKAREILDWDGSALFDNHLAITVDWYRQYYERVGV